MGKLEIEFHYETVKRKALKKIEMIKQAWEKAWAKASGNPEAEAELVPLKLQIQLMEMEAVDELKELEKKIAETD